MAKDNKIFIIIAIAAIAVLALFFFTSSKEQPGAVNIKEEVAADWGGSNLCTAREGVLVGMCCTTWDDATQMEKKVDCSSLVQTSQLQAFLTVGSDKLAKLSSVGFVFRVQNTGNVDTSFRINSIDVTSTTGDQASIEEVRSKLNSVVGVWKPAKKGASVDFSMSYDNRVRLDIPSGANAFTMKSGVYTVKINVDALDENNMPISAGFRNVDLNVEQETIAFNVDVITS